MVLRVVVASARVNCLVCDARLTSSSVPATCLVSPPVAGESRRWRSWCWPALGVGITGRYAIARGACDDRNNEPDGDRARAERAAGHRGCRGAGRADLPVVETFQAAGIVSRNLEPHYVGRVGLWKNQPGDVVVGRADVLVTIGYDPVEYDPRLWNTDLTRTIVHIDTVPALIDNHYRPATELRGDVAATVRPG
jgi:hypothetical protein